MDFLNKAFVQLNDLFRSMTVGARLTAGLLLVAVAVSIVYLFQYQTSGPDLYLMGGESLTAESIAAMRVAFAKNGLSAFEVEGDRIRVARGQQDKFLAALANEKALPPNFYQIMENAVNSQTSIMPDSRDVFSAKKKLATERQISAIVGKMKGIQSANVVFDTEVKQDFRQTSIKTALVSVKPVGSSLLDESQVLSIRQAVAAVVAGMKYEDVTVTDLNSGQTYGGAGNTSARDDPYYSFKRHAEQQWQEKILSALSGYPGVKVGVDVELKDELFHREREQKTDPKTVPLRTTEKSSSRTRDGSTPGGRAGFQANSAQSVASAGKGSHEEEEESTTTQENVASSTSIETEKPGLTPKKVKATVTVPASWFAKIWARNNPPAPGEQPKTPTQNDLAPIRTEEIAKIKSIVSQLIPTLEGSDPSQLVTVVDMQDIPAEPIPEPGMSEKGVDWLTHNWSTLGLIGLALFSLMALRSMIRSVPVAAPRPAFAAASEPAGEAESPAEAMKVSPNERRLQRITAGAPSLRDELSELVADDPDAAANILRTWIGATK